jgi:hypothetical protein
VRRGDATVAADRGLRVTAVYDVVLLAGSPRRLTLRLEPGLAREDVVEADGEQWTIADVRSTDTGAVQLICIHAE